MLYENPVKREREKNQEKKHTQHGPVGSPRHNIIAYHPTVLSDDISFKYSYFLENLSNIFFLSL